MKILVVDDEQDICEILQYNLETEGYEVATANSAEEAMELMFHTSSSLPPTPSSLPDLILLDVMMGEISGFQMARRLKGDPETAHIPIIFITALDTEDDTVKGLNIGADDYIAKPLSMREVKARVKAVLRRSAPSEKFLLRQASLCAERKVKSEELRDEIRYEGIVLNLDAKTATVGGEELGLTKLEFELLVLFLQHMGKVFSRNDLLERCWPKDVYVLDRTVDVNITRLRKKIGQYGKRIKTRVGYGYYFEG